ncbi:hypothetical protein B0A48_17661 [Cryoendolithus antarcticus]|uniref:Uncharacterized protein n=1 Tax=Cryoendolithus antarcticus TaxID=1507870 RepID=A0A1V8SBG6_9PEZI|nr:hypothetical protein B0A48_17661 [Cryoendolithus antarcticus]
MAGNRPLVPIESTELRRACMIDIDRMQYVLRSGRRIDVGRNYRREVREAYNDYNANQEQERSPSSDQYGTSPGSGQPSGSAAPRILRTQPGGGRSAEIVAAELENLSLTDSAGNRSRYSGNDSYSQSHDDRNTPGPQDEISDVQSGGSARRRTLGRSRSPHATVSDGGPSSSPAAVERRATILRLIRHNEVSPSDANDVANLMEEDHDVDAAIRIDALMKSGHEKEAAVRISELIDEGHAEEVAVQARELEEDDRPPATALAMARFIIRGESIEVAESITDLMRMRIQAPLAHRASQTRNAGFTRGSVQIVGRLLRSNYTLDQAIRIARRCQSGVSFEQAVEAED